MDEKIINVQNLTKTYRVPQRDPGMKAALNQFVSPNFQIVMAVNHVSFEINSGEIVALIGPNGAGKTTTLKVLTGLLQPTNGSILVAGYIPGKRQHAFLKVISMVLGNKSQMLWDIPALDTFHVLGEIYQIEKNEVKRRIDELSLMLEMEDILKKPVRNLSLGERMKCELVASLLHRPQVLFLDEPTLGLDISIQNRLRSFIIQYNQRYQATIMLTSHYMADIERLCSRVLLIHHGELIYDGALSKLSDQLSNSKLIRVTVSDPLTDLEEQDWSAFGAEILDQNHQTFTLRVEKTLAPACTAMLLNRYFVVDLVVENPPLEAVIDRIYQEGAV
jgi:ABC-2 type transport system ATP-binding protein